MQNRYTFDFENQVRRNLRLTIRKQETSSVWYKFLYAVFTFFSGILYPTANYIYEQKFLMFADFDSLKLHGKDMGINPKPGEDVESYRQKLRTYKAMRRMLLSVALSKSIFRIYCEVEAQILQGSDLDIFTIGITPIGMGVCASSMYWKFTWKAILPDLSAEIVNREEIMEILEEFNIASNEIIVVEDRPGGEWVWPAP